MRCLGSASRCLQADVEVFVGYFKPVDILDSFQSTLSICVVHKAYSPTPGSILLLQHLHAQNGAMRCKPADRHANI